MARFSGMGERNAPIFRRSVPAKYTAIAHLAERRTICASACRIAGYMLVGWRAELIVESYRRELCTYKYKANQQSSSARRRSNDEARRTVLAVVAAIRTVCQLVSRKPGSLCM